MLPNISPTKDNETTKIGQLIEYNITNIKIKIKILFEKSYTKFGGETIPRSFSKKSKFSISLEQ